MSAYEVKISYNPYTVKTAIEVNGKAYPALMEQVRNRRLSQWIDQLLPKILDELGTRSIKLVFEGTVLDEEDVRDAINLLCTANDNVSLEVDYITCNRSVDDRVNAIKALFDEAQNGPIDEFRSPAMHAAFNRAFSPEFEVNVLATMSAGKSTLINAMLGLELMPSKNEACTATIAKIYDHDHMDGFEAQRYNHDGQLLDDWTVVYDPASDEVIKRPTLLEKWNEDKETSLIEMRGDIPAINEREQVRLVLVDTPGPNNSRDESHSEATIRAITSNRPSMVLYVLNAQNLSTKDDKSLLKIIKDTMEKGGREAQDRFIFVANKIDAFDPERGELISSALENVRNYLEENGIQNPLVIPASAEFAMMLRTEKCCGIKALTSKQRGNLLTAKDIFLQQEEMNLLEHVKHDIGGQAYSTLKEKSEQGDEDNKAEIRSGIPIVEQLLENYISKHALPVRLKDVVDSFSAIAREVKQVKALNDVISQSETELTTITELIRNFKKDHTHLQEAKAFRDRVKCEKLQLSRINKAALLEVEKLYLEMVKELRSAFSADIALSEVEEIIESKAQDAAMFVERTKNIFETNLRADGLYRLNSLREAYQAYVANLLGKSFSTDVSSTAFSFQGAMLEMKSVEEMVMDGDVQIISQTNWYNPISWFREDKLNSQNLLQSFQNSLRVAMDENRASYEDILGRNFEVLKKQLLKEMDEIDARMSQTITELDVCENNKDEKEKKIKSCKEILNWYENFKTRLNQVVEITPSSDSLFKNGEKV